MGSEKNHIIYTAEDIQKYLSGKLGPAEMHAMEKAALDDAFLAEAMEGYQGMQEKEWGNQLILLKNKFSKDQTAKVIALKPATRYTPWKVAAAILIICSGGALVYILRPGESPQNKSIVAINTKQDSSTSEVAVTVSADTNTRLTSAGTAKTKIKRYKQPAANRIDQESRADSSFLYRPGNADKTIAKADAGGGYINDTQKSNAGLLANNQALPAAQNKIEQSEMARNNMENNKEAASEYFKKTKPVVSRKFMAQVVGEDGSPLPFSNISITNVNIGTYADAKGNFRLVSTDSVLNIEIKSAGYISRNYTLRSDMPQNKIVLAEDELALKEKTLVSGKISSYGSDKKRRAVLVPDSVINVEPEDGWNNYDTYITNNLSLPDNLLQRKIHGEVAISFDVQSDGAITNVKVDKSLCDDCDEAALRVIKEGPRWKVKKGNQGTAKVKVKF